MHRGVLGTRKPCFRCGPTNTGDGMPKVEDGAKRARPAVSQDIHRRGNRMLVAVARIEMFCADLDPLDKLIALNQALKNAIYDGSGGR